MQYKQIHELESRQQRRLLVHIIQKLLIVCVLAVEIEHVRGASLLVVLLVNHLLLLIEELAQFLLVLQLLLKVAQFLHQLVDHLLFLLQDLS